MPSFARPRRRGCGGAEARPARAKIEEMRLKEQAAALAEEQFAQQLTEANTDVSGLAEALKAFGSKSLLPGEIERLQAAIAELGAVNLAALDELEIATERKQYLDAQAADLTEAMATLESAIRQIDRESRALLQQTFDAVNENFAKLFPVLFGGGQARLVLTGEEILDSGVQVVAQPPGKRNTSIHLLSGGEKALTAISLVFALFQLNPAPFCLLDEVDAPLDDPNTGRFCRMVTSMAARPSSCSFRTTRSRWRWRPTDRHHDAGAGRIKGRGGRHRGGDRARRFGRGCGSEFVGSRVPVIDRRRVIINAIAGPDLRLRKRRATPFILRSHDLPATGPYRRRRRTRHRRGHLQLAAGTASPPADSRSLSRHGVAQCACRSAGRADARRRRRFRYITGESAG